MTELKQLGHMKYVAVILVIASFIGGAFVGYYRGISDFYDLESIANGVLATGYYKKLEEGNSSYAKDYFLSEIDMAIDGYLRSQQSLTPVMPSIFLDAHLIKREEYIARLVSFRKEVPEENISHLFKGEAQELYIRQFEERDAFIDAFVKEGP